MGSEQCGILSRSAYGLAWTQGVLQKTAVMNSPAAQDVPPKPFPYRVVVGRVYAVHGLLLLFFALIMPLAVTQTATAEWAEAMDMVGAGAYVDPARAVIPQVAGWASWIAAPAGLCMVGGLVAWLRRVAWPTDILAVLHLVLLPVVTWWGHVRAEEFGLGSIGNTISELVIFLTTMATVIFGVWVTRKKDRFGSDAAKGVTGQVAGAQTAGAQAAAAQTAGDQRATPPAAETASQAEPPVADQSTEQNQAEGPDRQYW